MRLGSLTSIKARTHWISPGSDALPEGNAPNPFAVPSLFGCEGPFPASPPASARWRSPIAKPACRSSGGAGENRTPDFRLAKAALSQLSYGPGPGQNGWWAILDSNQRPQSYQDCALTS